MVTANAVALAEEESCVHFLPPRLHQWVELVAEEVEFVRLQTLVHMAQLVPHAHQRLPWILETHFARH